MDDILVVGLWFHVPGCAEVCEAGTILLAGVFLSSVFSSFASNGNTELPVWFFRKQGDIFKEIACYDNLCS